MTSWYDGRATISTSIKVHPRQSLVVLARYSGVSSNSIEETKRIYPMAAAPLTVSIESDGICLGIPRQSENCGSQHKAHYQKRLAAAKEAKKETKEGPKPPPPPATPETTTKVVVPVVVPPEDEASGNAKAKDEISQKPQVAMETN